MSVLLDRIAAVRSGARVFKPVRSARLASVSVVVPCYNYGHYLPACLSSILNQPGVAVEALVVDDASTDGSGHVAERLAAHDARITVVRHVHNVGHIATYNDGLRRARGDYVVLLSADDLLTPESLERATSLMETHSSVGFAYGHAIKLSGESPPPARKRTRSWAVWAGRSWLTRRWRTGRNCIWSPEVVMRTAVQREIGDYRPDLPHTGDLDMWMRAAAISDVGYVEGADQAYYRVHDANMHAQSFEGTKPSGVLVDLQERRLTFERLAEEMPEAADLIAARRALAVEALKAVSRSYTWDAVDLDLLDGLLSFAVDAYPEADQLRWWAAAQRRRSAMAGGWRGRDPRLRLHETTLRAGGKARRLRWERVGA